jgi:hypothetical protein
MFLFRRFDNPGRELLASLLEVEVEGTTSAVMLLLKGLEDVEVLRRGLFALSRSN